MVHIQCSTRPLDLDFKQTYSILPQESVRPSPLQVFVVQDRLPWAPENLAPSLRSLSGFLRRQQIFRDIKVFPTYLDMMVARVDWRKNTATVERDRQWIVVADEETVTPFPNPSFVGSASSGIVDREMEALKDSMQAATFLAYVHDMEMRDALKLDIFPNSVRGYLRDTRRRLQTRWGQLITRLKNLALHISIDPKHMPTHGLDMIRDLNFLIEGRLVDHARDLPLFYIAEMYKIALLTIAKE
jgi:hypothetical protein